MLELGWHSQVGEVASFLEGRTEEWKPGVWKLEGGFL